MSWTDAWIGLRWHDRARGPEAYDCLGLYLAVLRHRLDIDLPDPAVRRAHASRAVAALAPSFARVDAPLEGDALLFRERPGRLHVGYALTASDMLHVHHEGQGSCIDRYTSPRWSSRLEGIYRPHA
ncbi:NLP/P60 protein [Roseivivax marinus]|uniref:NLP/P60 protein n=1 Tax=Roseivivax marinus TaxID=1379903 RepID=W4HEK0_9RHOB|nr:NlpC/P60 family protein [Roseivivax marinus]ETW11202.1 NLP/P60 protein [Roseivivax marinus]